MNTFGEWPNGESGLTYEGQLRREEILAIANMLVSPRPPDGDKVYQAASLDFTVGAIITRNGTDVRQVIYTNQPQGAVTLAPGEVAIVITKEQLSLPLNIVGSSLPVMSRAREGILVLSHGHIDPGFRGYLVVRLLNMGSNAYPLRVGARIITLTLEQIPAKAGPYESMPKDFEEVIDESARTVLQTFPAAVLLDIEGKGLRRLVEPIVEPIIVKINKKARKRFLAAVGGAAVAGAAIVKLLEALAPLVQDLLTKMR